MSVPVAGTVSMVPVVKAAEVAVIAPKDCWATTPEVSVHTAFSDGYVTNTSTAPVKLTKAPPAEEDSGEALRVRVVPEDV